jgi:hypothetical protein
MVDFLLLYSAELKWTHILPEVPLASLHPYHIISVQYTVKVIQKFLFNIFNTSFLSEKSIVQ